MKRQTISPSQKSELLNLYPNDITLEKLKYLFAAVQDRSSIHMPATAEFELNIQKELRIDPSKDPKEKGFSILLSKSTAETVKPMRTTVGRYVTNLFLFGGTENIRKNIPYINMPFTKKVIENINDLLARLLLENKITSDDLIDYIEREQWLGFAPTSFMSPSFEYESTQPIPAVIKLRDKLISENEAELTGSSESIILYQGLEKQILEVAKTELEKLNTGGLDIYESGASGSFQNNYKNSSIMRGFMPKSDEPTSFNFSKSNLSDGIQENETSQFADLAILASFSRAVGTQTGGYMTKLINAAFQHLQLNPDNESDCGTKYGLEVEISKSNMLDYHLRYYIKSPKELVLLTEDVLTTLVDQKIMIRSPVRCLDHNICSKCAGTQYYNMGILNVGLVLNRISSNVLNKALKKFHDLTIKISDLDLGNEIKPL